MHELSLAMSVVGIVDDEMSRRPGAVLRSVEVEVGALSGVETETFRSALDSVLVSSGYDGAHCELLLTPGRASCLACGHDFGTSCRYPVCPHCGSGQCIATGGTEFRVTSLSLA